MHIKAPALLLGGLAHSFMIVPDITPSDDALVNILPVGTASDAASRVVAVPCPGCPVDLFGEVSTTTPNHLELSFSIDHMAGFDRLLVNSFELYPNADPFSRSLAAPQVVDMGVKDRRGMMRHHKDKSTGVEMPLGYRIDIYPVAKDEVNQKLELVNIDLQILEVDQAFIGGIPTIHIKLIKDGENLAIAQVETQERADEPSQQPQCQDLWCRLKAMLNKGFGGFKKPCPGMMGHHGLPTGVAPTMVESQVDVPGHRHPHHHHQHHHHHDGQPDAKTMHAHYHHRFFHMIASVVSHVILPVLVGILAGIFVSLAGMAVISFFLVAFRRICGRKTTGGCPFHRRSKDTHAEVVLVEEEKSGLMENQEHQDPPPQYEEDANPRK